VLVFGARELEPRMRIATDLPGFTRWAGLRWQMVDLVKPLVNVAAARIASCASSITS